MAVLRDMRRKITRGLTQAGWKAAPAAPEGLIDAVEWLIGRSGPRLPVLAPIVRQNMKAAGVHDRAVFGAYFRHIATHLANGVRLFKLAPRPGAVARLAEREIALDASVDALREATRSGRGAIVAPAHCCNFLVALARLAQAVPVEIYLRWSSDARRLAMKRAWCEAAGIGVIIEPPDAGNPAARAAVCVDALRAGRILAITPDIAQRAAEGTPVEWLGRRAYLPAGPASLAMLAEVPLIPLFARYRGPTQVLYFEPPVRVEALPRSAGGRQESVRRAMQRWADGFSAFVRACPEAWFLWGDSRWTRVLRGDPKYGGEAMANSEWRIANGE